MAKMSHLLTQGLTTSRDSLSDNAFSALNISTVTKMDSDLFGKSHHKWRQALQILQEAAKKKDAPHIVMAWPFLKGFAGEPANMWPAG
jgi:hypothetical protein